MNSAPDLLSRILGIYLPLMFVGMQVIVYAGDLVCAKWVMLTTGVVAVLMLVAMPACNSWARRNDLL